jgi:hypothetical protein
MIYMCWCLQQTIVRTHLLLQSIQQFTHSLTHSLTHQEHLLHVLQVWRSLHQLSALPPPPPSSCPAKRHHFRLYRGHTQVRAECNTPCAAGSAACGCCCMRGQPCCHCCAEAFSWGRQRSASSTKREPAFDPDACQDAQVPNALGNLAHPHIVAILKTAAGSLDISLQQCMLRQLQRTTYRGS